MASDFSPLVLLAVVYATGIVVALAIALRDAESKDRAAVIRAVAELFRWFRRGGPPGAV
jgi:hypothetical protein